MLILIIRTDKPEAEIGLYNGTAKLAYSTWTAHRRLAETIHLRLQELLGSQDKKLHDIQGIVVYKGPGSFTGLRIGLSVANALAYSLDIPIASTQGKNWIISGCEALAQGRNETAAMPEYGSPPHVTPPKH